MRRARLDRVGRLARRMVETLRHSFNREPIVVLGGVCDGLDAYPKEWERCWRMIRIARAFGRTGNAFGLGFRSDADADRRGGIGRCAQFRRRQHRHRRRA
jgi:hypothetical protein